jgi:hypothetical protein
MEENSDNKNLMLVAVIFQWIAVATLAITIIGLAWSIPMAIATTNRYKNGNYKNMIALGVTSILFMGIVSGVLILIANENNN